MQGRRTASQPAATSSLNTIKHHSFIQTDGRMNGRTDGQHLVDRLHATSGAATVAVVTAAKQRRDAELAQKPPRL